MEQEYDWYGARYLYEDSTYYKGTAEEINAYLDKKLEDKTFSFYYARKFADFAGLYMVFFAIIMLAVLFLQDTKKHTYELLHTKPVTAGKYVMGKVSAGFTICLLVLTILNILFWVLCRIYTKDSGFEVRLWDFVASTVLYILPNMLMIVSIYTLISLIFKNPLPGVPLLILYMVYSNLGGTNAEGVYGYWGKPLAIMVRFPGQLFDSRLPALGGGAVRSLLCVGQRHRRPGASVFGPGPVLVLPEPTGHVGGGAGVQAAVPAAEHIDIPGHIPAPLSQLSLIHI